MSEHVHIESTKRTKAGPVSNRNVVRRRFADRELELYREMGYDAEARYCGDQRCLGPEPVGRL